MGFPLRVLVVEDSEDDAELLVWELQRSEYDVTYERVETSEEMKAAFIEQNWDIVISDFDMPRFSGLAALDILKDLQLDIPFIIVSGKIGEETAVDAMRAGANDYVMKRKLQRLIPAIQRELNEAEIRRERKWTEEQLHKSQETLAKAQKIARLGSWEWDMQSNEVHGSDEMNHILGLHKDTKPSMEIAQEMVHPDDREAFNQVLSMAFKGNIFPTYEFRIIKNDGEVRLINSMAEMRYDDSENLTWMLGTLQDVTELRKTQEEASRVRALEELEQLRNALWASVSHEIRTPLTSIIGMADSLVSDEIKWDEETQKDFLRLIDQEAKRLVRIVNDILDVSKSEAGTMPMDMHKAHLHTIFDGLNHRLLDLTCEHILELQIPDQLPAVIVDELRIGQLVTNLVENATAYSPKGTSITIRTHDEKDKLIITITDQGDGIPPEHLDMVFDRFYRLEQGVKRRRGGTGLGLAICKAIVEAHGGSIWVTSELGVGSVFGFSLPVAGSIEANDQPKLEQRAEV